MEDIKIDIEKSLVSGICEDYVDKIREALISGDEVYLKGIGVLKPKFRRVKNDKGRNYAIKIILKQDPDFRDDLIESYKNNKFKFIF